MSAHRFFLTSGLASDAVGGSVVGLPLSPQDLHHAVSVLRVRIGERIEVVSPDGIGWAVAVTDAQPDGLSAELLERLDPESTPDITLVQGVAKGEKMDAIVRQAVELGARAIIPLLSERCVVRLDETKSASRTARWRRVAGSAAEQSHRSSIPRVSEPMTLARFCETLADYDAVVVLWEDESQGGLAAALRAAAVRSPRVAVVVGPEGGLAASEVDVLRAAGAAVVGLGPTIMRTETAAIVGLALVASHLGGLGSDRTQ